VKTGQENPATADLCANYLKTKAVVLGASGFVGRWVARALCRCGAQLTLVVRDRPSAQRIFDAYGVEGEIVEQDLATAAESFQELFQDIRPSITFNLAGYGVDRCERDESTAYRINSDLVRTLCSAVAATRDRTWPGQNIVHVGSALEYGEIGGDLSEDSLPNPTTLYGQSKLAGTRALTECCGLNGLKGVTVRLFTVYGPGEHTGRLLPALIDTAEQGDPLKLTAGTQKRDFTYIEDVAEGLLRLGNTGAPDGKVVNLATGRFNSVREFAETAAETLSIPAEKLQFGAIPTREEEMAHAPVSIERLKHMINWAPRSSIEEGIRGTVKFMHESSVGTENAL
jgi:dTDP-glucose 4,6-dehydratase